jgi:hypothetical protein
MHMHMHMYMHMHMHMHMSMHVHMHVHACAVHVHTGLFNCAASTYADLHLAEWPTVRVAPSAPSRVT